MTNARQLGELAVAGIGKNVIINGNFNLWQRGTAFPAAALIYTADRWQWVRSGAGVVTVSRSTNVPDTLSEYSLLLQVTTPTTSFVSTDYYAFQYRPEGYDMQRFGWGGSDAQPAALSFWVRSAVTGIHSVGLRSGTNRRLVSEYTINVADTWEYKTITIPGDTSGTWNNTDGAGVLLDFNLAGGSGRQTSTLDTWETGNTFISTNQVNVMASGSNVFALSRVQLEVGSAATEFERRSIQQELDLCQRYYQKSYNLGTAPGTITGVGELVNKKAAIATGITSIDARFVPKMRVTPTVTLYSPVTGTSGFIYDYDAGPAADVSGISTSSIGEHGFRVNRSPAIAGEHSHGAHYTADAEL